MVVFLIIVDFLCFGLFSFNIHAIFHPDRYGIALPESPRSTKDHNTIQKGKDIAKQKKITIASLGSRRITYLQQGVKKGLKQWDLFLVTMRY